MIVAGDVTFAAHADVVVVNRGGAEFGGGGTDFCGRVLDDADEVFHRHRVDEAIELDLFARGERGGLLAEIDALDDGFVARRFRDGFGQCLGQ